MIRGLYNPAFLLRALLFLGILWTHFVVPSAPKAFAQDAEENEVRITFERATLSDLNGVEVTILLNAALFQGDTFVRADRLRDEGASLYFFSGNVQIIERGDTVYADVVHFNSETKIGEATGKVRMTDGAVSLESNVATYYSDEKRIEFESGVQYADSLTLLTSAHGTYWSEEARANFDGNVRLRQEDLYVEADSIKYAREEEVFTADGNVMVERIEDETQEADMSAWKSPTNELLGFSDAIERSLLFSRSVVHYGKTDSSSIRGDVFLLRTSQGEVDIDSLMVTAEHMMLGRGAAGDIVIATDSVSVVERDFSVTGDSLSYTRHQTDEAERFESKMFGSPVAWVSDSQIAADSLQVWGMTGAIDSLLASGSVFVANRDSTLDKIQQLKGRTLRAFFESDTLRTMSVRPNAEALYYIEPDPGAPVVAVHSSADQIDFTFENGNIMDVHAISGVEGTFYPDDLVDQVQNLAGYRWIPELKPDQSSMLLEIGKRQRIRAERKRALLQETSLSGAVN